MDQLLDNNTVAHQPSSPARTATVLVSELYSSIQGESTYAGRPCAFVRLTGCPLRCAWCDSEFAFHGGQRMALEDVLASVKEMGLPLVEVTGGEPLVQPGALALLRELCDAGYEVLLETSGALDISPVDPRVIKIMDLKCPGSGEVDANLWSNLEHLGPRDELKFVIAERADYDWARQIIQHYALADTRPIHFSPVFGSLEPVLLAEWIMADRLRVRLQIQLHKVLWPGEARGV